MNDLRKAAEELMPILERWKMTYPPCSGADWEKVEALRQALAQPECVDAVNMSQERVDETAKREHEPYGYVWTSLRDGMEVRFSRMPPNKFYNPQDIKPVYTAPPKREWVGLTRLELDIATLGLEDLSDCYKAIEAKLKEKNT